MKNPLKFIQDVKQEALVTWPTSKEGSKGLNGCCNGYCSYIFLLLDQVLQFFRTYFKGKFLMKNWYIVQSHSSFENKVAQDKGWG